jgi:Flp pilus assembly protein CpaB
MFLRRWSPVSKAFAALAIAGALGAYALVRGYATRLDALRPVTGAIRPLVVATRSLERGAVLTEPMLRLTEIPAAFAPPGAARSVDRVVGRILASDLAPGEPITSTRLAGADVGPVASLVPSGLRAFPIDAGIPPRSVRPGDRVDVMATFGGPHPHTETVAMGLEVLLVIDDQGGGTNLTALKEGTSLVLLVSPDDAEHLAYAKAFADLAVAIDGPE